eukprot:scaffold19531_cov106-Cylindrotheca_fusiformis.AAC.2
MSFYNHSDGRKRNGQRPFGACDVDALDRRTSSIQSPGRGKTYSFHVHRPNPNSSDSNNSRRSYEKPPRSTSGNIPGLPHSRKSAPSPMTSGSSISPPMDLKMPNRKSSMDKMSQMVGLRMPIRKPSSDKLSQIMGVRMPIRKPSRAKLAQMMGPSMPIRKPSRNNLLQRLSALTVGQPSMASNKSNESFPQSPASVDTTPGPVGQGPKHAHPNRRDEMAAESQGSSANSLHTLISLDGKEAKAFEKPLSIPRTTVQHTILFRLSPCQKKSE